MLFSSLRKLIDQLSRSPRRRGRRSQEVRPRKRSRPLLNFDHLEDRLSPAVITWTGVADGTSWNAAGNWDLNRVPGAVANDDVKALTDINAREFFMLSLLAIAVLYMGIHPKPFTDIMNVSVADFLKHMAASKL